MCPGEESEWLRVSGCDMLLILIIKAFYIGGINV